MTTTPNILQIDREAAAWNILRRLIFQHGGQQPWMDASTMSIRMGEQDDHWEVQAFAKHRISALNTIPVTHDERERIASYLRDVLTMDRCCAATLRQCADAVERGDHIPTEDKSDATG